jgi:hypothetical protein
LSYQVSPLKYYCVYYNLIQSYNCYYLSKVLAERYRLKYPVGNAYVTAYEAWPALNVRQERNRRFIPLSFVEAVSQDGSPTTEELLPAYRVAGDAFLGKMRKLFIILDDDVAAKKPAKAGSAKKKKRQASGEGSTSKKRPNSGESSDVIKKKPTPATQ